MGYSAAEKSVATANYLQDSLWTNSKLFEQLKVMQTLPCKVAQRWHSCCQSADLHISCWLPQAGRELEKCQSWALRAGSEQSGSRIGSGVLWQTNNEQKQEKMTIIWTTMWSILGSVQLRAAKASAWPTDGPPDHVWLLCICITWSPEAAQAWITSSAHDAGSSHKPRKNGNDEKLLEWCHRGHVLQCTESWQWGILAASDWSHMTDRPAHRRPINMSRAMFVSFTTLFSLRISSAKHVYEQWERELADKEACGPAGQSLPPHCQRGKQQEECLRAEGGPSEPHALQTRGVCFGPTQARDFHSHTRAKGAGSSVYLPGRGTNVQPNGFINKCDPKPRSLVANFAKNVMLLQELLPRGSALSAQTCRSNGWLKLQRFKEDAEWRVDLLCCAVSRRRRKTAADRMLLGLFHPCPPLGICVHLPDLSSVYSNQKCWYYCLTNCAC